MKRKLLYLSCSVMGGFLLIILITAFVMASGGGDVKAPSGPGVSSAPALLNQPSLSKAKDGPKGTLATQTQVRPRSPSSPEEALRKLHPDLREIAKKASPTLPSGFKVAGAPNEPILIEVIAKVGLNKEKAERDMNLSRYFVDGKFIARPPFGRGPMAKQVFIGYVYPTDLVKIASQGQVEYILPIVLERNAEPMPYPPDEKREIPKRGPEDWARLRANADKLREGVMPWNKAKAFGDGRAGGRLMDWFEVLPEGPHKAKAAWERGYHGEGVTVAVLDDGIDAAHSDLMGTQKIYSSTIAPQYNGWPMVFSPFSMLLYAFDSIFGTTFIADGFPGVHYVDTSMTPFVYPCGSGISCFRYTPLIDYAKLGIQHTYVISNTMTKSGIVHVGTHPDNDLRDFIWGEKVAVLVCDPHVAGVYDTVYVDLDDDYDFRDEKPLTRADVNDPFTYNSMIAYRDMSVPPDGIPDISGGMLYFIADGVTPIPVSEWMYGGLIPGNGDLVAFSGSTFDGPYSHGTQCASNVVGQGRARGMLPEFRNLPGSGKPPGAVFGMAPGAKVVNVSDIYYNFYSSILDAYIFAAVGYDGLDQTDPSDSDAIQITSNSYGMSDVDNDGWEYEGQLISQIQRWFAPYLQFLFSTGNGAPAYGTVAPPSPATGIGVGASTEFGSTGWDSITETTQIMFNDVIPFSNRGPGARGTNGVDVVAGGAFAAGDEELNYYSIYTWDVLDGNLCWDSWGGTSRSAPVAMGVLALIEQAFHEANGRWPTYDEARALLMSTATDLNYDTFTQGAGSVNADRGTAVAGGHYGLYVEGSAPEWQPGFYRGVDYPGFAHIAYPGDVLTKTFTIHNTGPVTITASIDDAELHLIGTHEFTFTITSEMVAAESAYGDENRDNFFKAFNYFIPITATAAKIAQNPAWANIPIPPDTDLMIVRQMFPYDQFDADGDYNWDNRFYLVVYNWKDVNGDGNVWEDKDGNGVVNFINSGDPPETIDGGDELVWDDLRTEIDRWEFGRFGYHRPGGNRNEMWIHDPLDRMIDGLFIGLRHHPGSTYTGTTTLRYRIEFYKKTDVPWLTESASILEIAPHADATFVATAAVPTDMPAGEYQAAIEVHDPGRPPTYTADTSIIPVVLSVAAPLTGGLQLAGYEAYNYDQGRPYNNGAVRGLFDWTWRAESGDWRFFFSDLKNCTLIATLLEEDFEGSFPPPGWTVITNAGAGWNTNTYWGVANLTTGSGQSADADSDAFGAGMDTELWSPPIDLTGTTAPVLVYESNFQDCLGDGDAWLDISTDGGATWTNLTWWTEDHGPTTERVDLSGYIGQTIILRWHYASVGWAWYWQIDDVRILDLPCAYLKGTKFLVKDEWEDTAPHTDIDTIVLGPTPTSLGTGWYGFPEPSYYGPYVLDTIGRSPNTYMGSGKWRFNTSSGANEDLIIAPFPDWQPYRDGLHEFLQHNVLFEGDNFDVVFTKTIGTLQEKPHSFEIDSYVDQGMVGVVTVTVSLPLKGLVADAFGLGGPEYLFNEPLPFVAPYYEEWHQTFTVTHGAKIEMWTFSSDISDIDMYLYYCGPTGAGPCELRASSTTPTAMEHVLVMRPEDGVWLVGIDNWSGPAGHFDLTKVVVQGYDLSVSGLPIGAIPPNTPVTFTVHFSRPMVPNERYEGLLLLGPPEAPTLKEVPIVIHRLAAIEKRVNHTVSFPGNELQYTISIYNIDPTAYWEFIDSIPENTEFVTVTNAIYDPVLNRVVYTGTLRPGYNLINLTVRITDTVKAGTLITNTGIVRAPSLFSDTQSASVTTCIGSEDFSTSHKLASSQVRAGDIITYEIHVLNTGDELAYLTLTDTIPVSTTFESLYNNPPYQHFKYNAAMNQVEWAGNIAPGDEWIFSFQVRADNDIALWWKTITNTAFISWEGNTMDLTASTRIVPPYTLRLLMIMKNFTP